MAVMGNSAPDPETPLSEVGEFEAIALVTARFEQGDHVLVPPGDDAAQVRSASGMPLFATDVLVDARHFRRDWASAEDIGRRAAAQSLSDINAMGGRATALTVGLTAPPDLSIGWMLSLADGLAAECAEVGASVVGGDMTRGDLLMLSVSAMGEASGDPVRRSGARPGDVVAVRGRLGWAAAGVAVLGRGFRSPRVVVEAYRRPEVPYDAGPEGARLGATSMIDVSDGLVADVGHVASASAVVVDLQRSAFAVPDPIAAVGAAVGVDPLDLVLTGGDDHALVATYPPAVKLPETWTVVGSVLEASAGRPAGAVLLDGEPYEGTPGFRHF